MKSTKRLLMAIGCSLMASFCMGCMNSKTCLSSNNEQWLFADSVISEKLGDELSDKLFAPDEVKCYSIVYKDSIGEKDVVLTKNFVRDTLIAKVSPSQLSILQFVLLCNETNYSKDSIKIQSPFRPVVEFEFVKKNHNNSSIVFSLSDHTWMIVEGGVKKLQYNYCDSKLLERFCNLFLESKKGGMK